MCWLPRQQYMMDPIWGPFDKPIIQRMKPLSHRWGPDSLNPPYKRSSQADRGQVVSCQLVIAGGNAPEVLEPVESILDAPAQLVESVVEAERLLPVAFVGNDRVAASLMELAAQFGAVVGLVAKHVF